MSRHVATPRDVSRPLGPGRESTARRSVYVRNVPLRKCLSLKVDGVSPCLSRARSRNARRRSDAHRGSGRSGAIIRNIAGAPGLRPWCTTAAQCRNVSRVALDQAFAAADWKAVRRCELDQCQARCLLNRARHGRGCKIRRRDCLAESVFAGAIGAASHWRFGIAPWDRYPYGRRRSAAPSKATLPPEIEPGRSRHTARARRPNLLRTQVRISKRRTLVSKFSSHAPICAAMSNASISTMP